MMGKVGGNRNFGYGKQMEWAGKNALPTGIVGKGREHGAEALAERYGDGHYATQAAHGERWGQFAAYAGTEDVKDAREVSAALIVSYGQHLVAQVQAGTMKVAYAQNLLSTVNVVLETMRGDRELRVSPASLVGQRSHVREVAPAGLERGALENATRELRTTGEPRVAAVVELARELGLRFREASLLDAKVASAQARELGRINVTEGTKGGRGREIDRWVPVSARADQALRNAATVQREGRNLIPPGMSFRQWRDHAYGIWRTISVHHGLAGFHNLRAAYACERYEQLTGSPAHRNLRRSPGKPAG